MVQLLLALPVPDMAPNRLCGSLLQHKNNIENNVKSIYTYTLNQSHAYFTVSLTEETTNNVSLAYNYSNNMRTAALRNLRSMFTRFEYKPLLLSLTHFANKGLTVMCY